LRRNYPWLLQGPHQKIVRQILAVALVFVAAWLIAATKR
jgi:hypothetical protein